MNNLVRADFPILQQILYGKYPLVYLDNAASTQRPTSVIEVMNECYRQTYANVHRGNHWLGYEIDGQYESARENVARFFGTNDPGEIVFTSGTTASINLVARSWSEQFLRAGDEILLTELEHHSNLIPWQQAAARHGASVRFSPVSSSGKFDLEIWRAQLTPQTKFVSFTALSNVTGQKLPVVEMVKAAHDIGAVALVDAAQWIPHEPCDVQHWQADFVACSGHKMLGPTGIGVLFGKRNLLEAMPPFLGGGSMISRVSLTSFDAAELPAKFEAGTPPIVEAIGLSAAINYLRDVGLDQIAAHEKNLAIEATQQLAQIDGIRFLSDPVQPDSGIVTFCVPGLSANDIATLIDLRGIAVRVGHHCAMPLHDALGIPASVRASFYLYNTLAEVHQLAEAASHVIRKIRA